MTDHPSADAARIREMLIQRATDGCEGPLDDACFRTKLPLHLWCDPCRCQEAAKALTRSEQARQEAEQRATYEERRANTLRDERNKCTEAARLNGTADVAALRVELANMTADRDTLASDQAAVSQERNAANEAFTSAHGELVKLRAERERLREALQRIGNAHYALKKAELVMSGGFPVVYGGRSGAEQTALNDAIVAALASTPPSQEPT